MARLTAGLATGAPLSACKKMKPRHPWPPQSDKSIYDVVFEAKHYIPGKTVNVTIIGGRYRGFMLQARKTNTRITFGRWKDPPKFSKLLKGNGGTVSLSLLAGFGITSFTQGAIG
eukprot:gi/632935815/ref/XP_007891359.1/ PREDICTED: putative defense protein isoform X2 [Callorhinchus milii]